MRVVLFALATLAVGLAGSPRVASADEDPAALPSAPLARQVERAPLARQVEGADIKVGDQLQATRDVSLDEAIIAEGSKVSVSGKRSASGRVLLDVALADGHVVRGVPLVEIRKSFRRVP